MFNQGFRLEQGSDDEPEKPFWISYADLMTALMVVFLVVMVASLLSLTQTLTSLENSRSKSDILAAKYNALQKKEAQQAATVDRHNADISRFWNQLQSST